MAADGGIPKEAGKVDSVANVDERPAGMFLNASLWAVVYSAGQS